MTLFATKPACWAPGLAGDADWKDWLEGRRAIERTDAQPPLSFTPPLFRRRLSQLSRMTVQVVHDALELAGVSAGEGAGADAAGRTGAAGTAEGAVAGTATEDGAGTAEEPRAGTAATGTAGLKQSFVSFRGELSRQLSINKTLITEQDVLPASFSLSVFNTPMALASMACHLTGGYSVLFPPADSFYDGFLAACAPLLCGEEDRLLFVYADENVPAEYAAFCPDDADPLAFATVLSVRPLHEGGRQQTDNGGLQAGDGSQQAGGGAFSFELSDVVGKTPASFLRMLLGAAGAVGTAGRPGNARERSLSSTGGDFRSGSVGQ